MGNLVTINGNNPSPRVFLTPPAAFTNAKNLLEAGSSSHGKKLINSIGRRAEIALDAGPFSVTDKTTMPPSGTKQDYLSLAPYWWPNPQTDDGLPYIQIDGKFNPEAKTNASDSLRLKNMVKAVEDLAYGSFFLNDLDMAERAVLLLRRWFMDPQTRMNPHLSFAQSVLGRTPGRSLGIIDALQLTRIVDCIGLLGCSDAWEEADQRLMIDWFGKYLDWLLESGWGDEERKRLNNHGTWADTQLLSYSLFLGRHDTATDVLKGAMDTRIGCMILPDGSQPSELSRTRSFYYSTYNLRALFDLATMGENVGFDLWNFETADGRSIRAALDFIAPYALSESHWPYKEISTPESRGDKDLLGLLRRASIIYGDPDYENLIEQSVGQKGIPPRIELLYPALFD